MSVTNLFVKQGTFFSVVVDIDSESDQPFDLSGYQVISQMRKSYYSNTFYPITAEIEGDPSEGKIKLSLDPQSTTDIRSGRFVYDVLIKNTQDESDVKVIMEGILTLNPQVSRF